MVCSDRFECIVAQQLIQNCFNILTSILHLSAYMPMIHNIATVEIFGPHLIIYSIIQETGDGRRQQACKTVCDRNSSGVRFMSPFHQY